MGNVRRNGSEEAWTDWLWEGRIPRGALTILTGVPEVGKSMFAAYIASQVSSGRPWEDERGVTRKPGSVLYLSADDDPNTMTGPRFLAAGADTTKIATIDGLFDMLGDVVSKIPDLQLIVLDPIIAYVGVGDEYRDSEMGEFLNPLVKLAKDRNLAIVGVTNLDADAPWHKAFIAAAKAVWRLREDDPKRVLVVRYKWSPELGWCAPGLAFSIDDAPITFSDGTDGEMGYCLFENEANL